MRVAIFSCDPSRRKTGGALLGDRIRMNAIGSPRVYMRSLATRRSATEIPAALPDAIMAVKAAGFDLVIAETAGIGQGDSSITDLVDVSLYVMTSEFGAASQLEKIDMLDFADLVAVNKYEKRGGEDAVRTSASRSSATARRSTAPPEEMPVFGTIASKFNDDGVTRALPRPDGRRRRQDRGALRHAPAAAADQDLLLEDHHHPTGADALPERDRRDPARLPRQNQPPDGGPAPGLAPIGSGRGGRCRDPGRHGA